MSSVEHVRLNIRALDGEYMASSGKIPDTCTVCKKKSGLLAHFDFERKVYSTAKPNPTMETSSGHCCPECCVNKLLIRVAAAAESNIGAAKELKASWR